MKTQKSNSSGAVIRITLLAFLLVIASCQTKGGSQKDGTKLTLSRQKLIFIQLSLRKIWKRFNSILPRALT